MDRDSDEETALQRKKAAALQRVEEHIAWKRAFFQARPAPPPIGRLHRRQQGKTKNTSCHAAFCAALAVHAKLSEAEAQTGGPESAAAGTAETGGAALTTSPMAPLSPQEAWAAQLRGERERRNPATDLNVRSDPTRTVIMANLHPDTVDEDLRHFADQFGRVVGVRIVRHHKTGKSRRYAFVEFGLAGEARKALQFHRKKRLRGHAIIIDRERGRTDPGFLPSRMAAAEAFVAAQKAATPTSTHSPSSLALSGADRKGESGSSSSGGGGGGGVEAAVKEKCTPAPTLLEDDDDFLNSILNS